MGRPSVGTHQRLDDLLLIGVWVLVVGGGLVYLSYVLAMGDLWCDRYADSNFRELSWSALPPGRVCTWSVERNGYAAVKGPGAFVSVWLVGALVVTVPAAGMAARVWRNRG